MREHAAAEEGAKLLLDESRCRLFPERRAGEEAFELLPHDLVKKGLLRLMALVLGHEIPDRDRRGWNAAKEARADRPVWHWGDAGSARVGRCGAAIGGRRARRAINEPCLERERLDAGLKTVREAAGTPSPLQSSPVAIGCHHSICKSPI